MTADFLELCCQIAKCFSTEIAGRFVQALLDKHNDKLDFLRIDAGWNFEGEFAEFPTPESSFIIKRIELRKVA
ncbi:hypothetical protein [Streptomyces griseosporeus]|uniref:hypothetical protein n=1 Tax=Streptomyces griseosporeus TaxID=1910 RepID=UPI00167CDB39|nr:hypothetical protein [Streptomyces griseosporeus]